jgi:hypothetical protein
VNPRTARHIKKCRRECGSSGLIHGFRRLFPFKGYFFQKKAYCTELYKRFSYIVLGVAKSANAYQNEVGVPA